MIDEVLHPHEMETVFPGMDQGWFFDRKIVVYRLTTVSRNILRDWSELVMETIKSWPDDYPYLAMHDLAATGVSLQYAVSVSFETSNTGVLPEYRQQVYSILNSRSTLGNRVALTFNLMLSGRLSKTLVKMQRIGLTNPQPVQYQAFYDQVDAVQWLAFSVRNNNNIAPHIRNLV